MSLRSFFVTASGPRDPLNLASEPRGDSRQSLTSDWIKEWLHPIHVAPPSFPDRNVCASGQPGAFCNQRRRRDEAAPRRQKKKIPALISPLTRPACRHDAPSPKAAATSARTDVISRPGFSFQQLWVLSSRHVIHLWKKLSKKHPVILIPINPETHYIYIYTHTPPG